MNLVHSRLHPPMHSMKAAVEVEQRRVPVAKNRFVAKTRMALRRPVPRLNIMRSPRRRVFAPIGNQRIKNKTRYQVEKDSALAQVRRVGRFGFFPRQMYPINATPNRERMREMNSALHMRRARWRRRESRSAKNFWEEKKH